MKQALCWLILLLFWSTCGRVADERLPQSDRIFPDHESWSSTIVLSKEGLKRAVIWSGHLAKYEQQAQIQMDDNVEVDFFDRDARHLSHLKSRQALVNERTNDLIATGQVVVVSDSGMTLYTEELRWDHQKEKIRSDTSIRLVTETDTLTGVGFESDSDLKNWIIYHPAGVTDRQMRRVDE